MIRFLAAFVVLFAAAAAFVSMLPTPPKVVAAPSMVASQLRTAADPAAAKPAVRVVYPASGVEASTVDVRPDVVSTTAAAPVAVAVPVYPQVAAAPAPYAVGPADASAQAGTANVNINTASIDALNGIPGAGRIGRTIASHRPYASVEDLLRKRVVRKSVYDRIKDEIAAE